MFRRRIVRIHRPARENSDLRSVNRKRDRCIFHSAWVKRVCCVSKISSDCGCQSKEVGVGMEVRLLSVGTRGFSLPASRLVIAASSVAPNEKKTSGTRVYVYMNSFISNNYLPDVAVACSNRYPQFLGNEKLCLETGGADLQCILSLFCSAETDRARVRRNRSNGFAPTNPTN